MKKKLKEQHCANSKFPKPDNFGTGIRNKRGRLGDSYMGNTIKKNNISIPPKSLA